MSYLPDVADIVALRSVDTISLPDNSRVRVLTLLQEFWYDKQSNVVPDNITILMPISPAPLHLRGRWLRNPLPVPEWTAKRTWYQDNVAGKDENAGDQSTPVRTIAEVARRLCRIDSGEYTVDVVGQVESSDSVAFSPQFGVIKSPVLASSQTVASILIRGKRTEVAPIEIDAVTNTDPATNTQAEVRAKDPTFDWTPHIGLFLEATWAAGPITITVQAVILKVRPLGAVRVSEWVDPLTGMPILIAPPAPAAYLPSAGATYKILSLTPFAAQIGYSSLPPRVQLSLQDLTISSPPVPPPVPPSMVPGLLASASTTMFSSCRFTVPIAAPPATYQTDCSIRACSVHFADPAKPQSFCSTAGGTGPRFSGCGLINGYIQISSVGRITLTNTVLQGGAIRGVDKGRIFGGLYAVGDRLGIFDSPTGESAITLRRGMVMHIQKDAKLYGSGNAAYGIEVLEAASLAIQTDAPPLPPLPPVPPLPPPTLTGARGDLWFEGAGTAIPELQAGQRVPTAQPLTTWVHWASAPFNRNVLSYRTGARIISTA